jgi:hypothetical protein
MGTRGLRHRLLQHSYALLVAALGAACREAPEPKAREIVTQVEALTPSPGAAGPFTASAPRAGEHDEPIGAARCPEVQRQASNLAAGLPRRLDADTLATGVTAQGCDLIFEYELTTLDAKDVAAGGMAAMSSRVSEQLCSDRGALAVMQRGGRFTNVYYDRARVQIGLFTVTADDCGI